MFLIVCEVFFCFKEGYEVKNATKEEETFYSRDTLENALDKLFLYQMEYNNKHYYSKGRGCITEFTLRTASEVPEVSDKVLRNLRARNIDILKVEDD